MSPINECKKLESKRLAGFDAETELRRKMKQDAKPDTIEEGRSMRGIKDPGQPTQARIDEHNLTHCPFEAWCSHCVRGRAPEDPRRKNKGEVEEEVEEGAEE